MNARKHRNCSQATRGWLRLGPKGKQPGSGAVTSPDADLALPVYRADLNHPVNIAEHGNAVGPARSPDRADLTARRVRGRSIGRTEEAKASGNALDTPTSVWSEMARTHEESLPTRTANDDRRLPVDASWVLSPPRSTAHYDRRSVLPSGCTDGVRLVRQPAGRPEKLRNGRPYEGLSRMKLCGLFSYVAQGQETPVWRASDPLGAPHK